MFYSQSLFANIDFFVLVHCEVPTPQFPLDGQKQTQPAPVSHPGNAVKSVIAKTLQMAVVFYFPVLNDFVRTTQIRRNTYKM